MNILQKICDRRRGDVALKKQQVPLELLLERIKHQAPPKDFLAALQAKEKNGFAIIAEAKKASPSHGLIRPIYDVAAIAHSYQEGGAACLSILTEETDFQGAIEDLASARAAVSIPILRKDFMVDAYQVYEARAYGADAILLILSALSDAECRALEDLALSLGMAVLLESHDEEELKRALQLKSPLIGINHRNLKTLKTDISLSRQLRPLVPADKHIIGESGLVTHGDLELLAKDNIRSFLIGESLLRELDPGIALKKLLKS